MNNGFIVLHRKFIQWEWYTDLNTKVVMLHLILIANHEGKRWRGVFINRGETIITVRRLANETGLTIQNVRTAIKHLVSTQEITYELTKYGMLIKVINYSKYQDKDSKPNKRTNNQTASKSTHEVTQDQHKGNTAPTHNNNDNNDNNDNNKTINTNAQSAKSASEPTVPTAPKIPLVDGSEWQITVSFFEELTTSYPAVDPMTELARIRTWCIANPKNRKTPRGVKRFVNSWFARSQNQARVKQVVKPTQEGFDFMNL